jgi:hypothetical protein
MRRIARDFPRVRVCWDLDNTLVDSGTLLRAGRTLDEAIVEARPVPNMVDLYRTMKSELPESEHVILSARLNNMRAATLAWLELHEVLIDATAVCFVPYASAKPRIWARLARGAMLVIVDDLTYNHESEQVAVHDQLVNAAERLADLYVGIDDIRAIAADATAVGRLVERVRASIAA